MPLKTLTRQQFQQKRPGGDYSNYLRYIAARRRPIQPQTGQPAVLPSATAQRPVPTMGPGVVRRPGPRPFDPYAATPWAQLEARARSDVYTPYNSMIDAITQALTGKAALAVDKERARGSALAAALAPIAGRISGTFNTAANTVSGDANRIAGGLTQQGNELGSDIHAKLQGIQAPTAAIDQFAGGAGRVGQGAAGAMTALGTAEMERLRGTGAAEAGYAAALPGIEQLKTLKELGLIREGLSEQLLENIGNLQTQAAREYGNTIRGYRDEETAKGEARYKRSEARRTERQEQLDRQWEAAVLKQAYGMPLTPREKALINRYGSSPKGIEAAGETREAAKDRQSKLAVQKAKDQASMARQKAKDAAAAARQAEANAARSQLQRDKDRAAAARQRAKDAAAMARKAVDFYAGLVKGGKAKSTTKKPGKTSADAILGG